MENRLKLLLIVAFIVTVIIHVDYSYAAKNPRQEESINEFTAYLDGRITKIMKNYDIPGVSIALIHDGEMVWSNAYGYADIKKGRKMTVDTVCRVESISKSVTAWGVMKLAEKGKIHLDEPVHQYFKNWEIPKSAFPGENITIRQLLSHSSGMPLGTIGLEYSPQDIIPSIEESLSKEAKLIREPGSAFEYSNVGFNLLELLIQEVTAQSFTEYMDNEILKPLEMNNSSFDWSEKINPEVPVGYDLKGNPVPVYVYSEKASGGMFANVEDVARFIIAGMTKAEIEENKVLSLSSVYELYNSVIGIPGMYGMVADSYGLGYFVDNTPDGKKAVFHGGQGHGWMTHFHFFPEEGEGIVILANSQRSWPLISYILRDWSKWSLATKVGMERILQGIVGMWVVIGLILMGSMYLFWITGSGILKGHRSFLLLSKRALVTRSLQFGSSIGLIWGVTWSMNQKYLFISSIFPLAFDWLTYSTCVLAIALLLSALFPVAFGKGKVRKA